MVQCGEKGATRPEHIREAYRRLKKDGKVRARICIAGGTDRNDADLPYHNKVENVRVQKRLLKR